MNHPKRPPVVNGLMPSPDDGITLTEQQCFTVVSAGLDARQLRLVDIAFRYQAASAWRFRYIPAASSDEVGVTPDIVLANPLSFEGIKALSLAQASRSELFIVHVLPAGAPARSRYAVSVDRISLQLLNCLNELVMAEGLVAPSVDRARVGEDPAPNPVPDKKTPPFPASLQLPDSLDLDDLPWPADLPRLTDIVPVDRGIVAPPGVVGDQTCDQESELADPAPVPVPVPVRQLTAPAEVAEVADSPEAPEPLIQQASQPAGPEPLADVADTNLVAANPRRLKQALIVGASVAAADQIEKSFFRLGARRLQCARTDDWQQTLEQLDCQPCQLVVIARSLYGNSGFTLGRELRRRYPEIVVVILAEQASMFDRMRARFAGCAGVLTEPVGPRQLKATVQEPLRRARARHTYWAKGPEGPEGPEGQSTVWGLSAWPDTTEGQ